MRASAARRIESGSPASRWLSFARTRFIGRDRELGELRRLLGESNVVTIVGGAGVGKTRIALELVRRLSNESVGSAHAEPMLVDLSTARTADDVLRALVEALRGSLPGVDRESQLDRLVAAFENAGPVLVVFDNAEGCREGLSEVLERLVATEDVRVLVTSRVRLGLVDELVLGLEGLSVVDEAVDLFVDRAKTLRPGLSSEDSTIPEIVSALEGIPLAIELAAARSLTFTSEELLQRIRASMLDTLVRPLDRRDSMRARYAWSLQLLPDSEVRALTELSVVGGPMTLDEAESLLSSDGSRSAGESAALVEALREHSLVRRVEHGIVLYSGVRELMEKTGERAVSEAARDRWHSMLAARAFEVLHDYGDEACATVERLEPHAREAAAAIVGREAVGPDDPWRLAVFFGCIARVVRPRGPLQELISLGPECARLAARHPPALAIIQTFRAISLAQVTRAATFELLREGMRLAAEAHDAGTELAATLHLALVLARDNLFQQSRELLTSLRAANPTSADRARISHVAAALALAEGDPSRAAREIEDAVAHAKIARSTSSRSRAEGMAAHVYLELGNLELAAAHAAGALECAEIAGDRNVGASIRASLAEVMLLSGQTGAALEEFQRVVLEASGLGAADHAGYAMMCRGFAQLLLGRLVLAKADLTEAAPYLADRANIALSAAGRAYIAAAYADAPSAIAFLAEAVEADPDALGARALCEVAIATVRKVTPDVPLAELDAARPTARRGPRIGDFVASQLAARSVGRDDSTLECKHDGFDVAGHGVVALSAKPRLLALYRALADANLADRQRYVARASLVAVTWPGEKMRDEAASNRLRVALSTLRKLGLPLETAPEGVRIAHDTAVLHPSPKSLMAD